MGARSATALAASLALLLAACGSTVRTPSGAAGDLRAPDAFGAPTSEGSVADSGTGPAAPGAPGAQDGAAAPPKAANGSSPGAGSSVPVPGSSGSSESGPGWDEKYVYVGVVTQKDSQEVFASFGAKNVDPGDTEKQALAAAAAVNAAGGVLGRQIKVLFMDTGILETAENPSAIGQEACIHFSQDHRVVAVWSVSTQIDQAPTLRTCLANAGVAYFSNAVRAVDDQLFRELAPSYYHGLVVSWTRLAPVLVERLKARGWFSGWDTTLGRPSSLPPVVGVLVQDQPQGQRTATYLQQALSAEGFSHTEVFRYSDPSQGQLSAVHYFKGKGVTHVVVTDVELTAFQQSAASQGYRPRYGITTYNAPYNNLEASGLTPAGANTGAMGVGWSPAMDVSDNNDPGPTPGWSRCNKAMAAQGQVFAGKRLARAYASSMCDTMFALAGGAAAGRGLTAPALRAGITSIGPRFPVAIGFSPALKATSPYFAGSVRDLTWVESCSCVKYENGGSRL